MQKQPNRFLAPIVIAGITVGFLASAYKFIFINRVRQNNHARINRLMNRLKPNHRQLPQKIKPQLSARQILLPQLQRPKPTGSYNRPNDR